MFFSQCLVSASKISPVCYIYWYLFPFWVMLDTGVGCIKCSQERVLKEVKMRHVLYLL